MIPRRSLLAALAAGCTLPGRAVAQAWPSRIVTLVVPYPPGGSSDISARLAGDKLSGLLGQRVIIDNKPGAGGNLGMELVSRAAPDGYTVGLMTTAHAINKTLFRNPGYDTLTDFEPVAHLTENPLMLVVPPGSPARSVTDLIAMAKARPGSLNFASSGIGNSPHLTAELFCAMAGIRMTHVPYRGSAPAAADVVAGHVDLMFDTTQSVLAQAQDGRLRALGITSAQRLPNAPDIPTIAEAALPGFVAIAWNGLVAPRGTPPDVVAKLNTATIRAMKEPDVADKLEKLGAVSKPLSPAEFSAFVRAEVEKWGAVVRQSGAKID